MTLDTAELEKLFQSTKCRIISWKMLSNMLFQNPVKRRISHVPNLMQMR